jgi:flavin reductase
MPVTSREFRDAMARLGAAVNVVTTDGAAGRGGLTASAVCSVTDDPPTLLVCLNRTASLNELAKRNGVLCVNTLGAAQQAISDRFAGRDGVERALRFDGFAWTVLATGAPVLEDAVACFDCRIAEVLEKGTHSVLFAEVEAVRAGPGAGGALIWYARDYHPVGAAA